VRGACLRTTLGAWPVYASHIGTPLTALQGFGGKLARSLAHAAPLFREHAAVHDRFSSETFAPTASSDQLARAMAAGLAVLVLTVAPGSAGEREAKNAFLREAWEIAPIAASAGQRASSGQRVTVKVGPLDPSRLAPTDFADWDREERR
jgi:hypothetical protein